ncbi:MAG: ribose 5-phosphate isomerase B [Bacteroidales bacterium]|nr:ribose 5-phosphate isomerase B [Bacteroidales bacterium]
MKVQQIVIASDHAGYKLKKSIIKHFSKSIYFTDLGTHSADSCDYPDYAHKACIAITRGEIKKGILICGSGNGMTMAANKHQMVRCALAWNVEIAQLARQHNDANVLSLPARFISEQEAFDIVEAFMVTEFEGGRHENRVRKIAEY